MRRLAGVVVPLANLVPLVRVAVIAAILAPALLVSLAPVLGAALACGIAATVFLLRGATAHDAPLPESRNPAEMGTALRFAAVYALVLFVSAWLSDLAGSGGLFATAALSGLVDIDPIVLSALNLFGDDRLHARHAVAAILLAYTANVIFKLGVAFWFDRTLGARVVWPLLATVAGGVVAFFFVR
jgi:uncharacterized membrane protein (DUF4010 family)